MSDVSDKLIVHAAAYFASIQAGKEPGPVDPFLAGLISNAIRERAKLPVNGANGAAKPEPPGAAKMSTPARRIFDIVNAAGVEGLQPHAVAERAGINKMNVQYHLLALAKKKLISRSHAGYYSTWNGATATPPRTVGEPTLPAQALGVSEHMAEARKLLRGHFRVSGRVMTLLLATFLSDPKLERGYTELLRSVGKKSGSLNRSLAMLLKAKLVTKTALGRYHLTGGA